MPNLFSGRCFEDGVDSAGNDIANFRVSSIDECQNECKKLFNCKLFVFAPSTKNCWLKHTPSARTVNTDRITGPRVCTGICFFTPLYIKKGLMGLCLFTQNLTSIKVEQKIRPNHACLKKSCKL